MFRRLEKSLPREPKFPKDLAEQGFCVTDSGLVRKIELPNERFLFRISDNERYNELHREAHHGMKLHAESPGH